MISIKEVNKVFDKFVLPKAADFILRKRFCYKHLREFVKKNKVPITNKINVVSLLGICSKCNKAGIVYYLEGDIKDKNV